MPRMARRDERPWGARAWSTVSAILLPPANRAVDVRGSRGCARERVSAGEAQATSAGGVERLDVAPGAAAEGGGGGGRGHAPGGRLAEVLRTVILK